MVICTINPLLSNYQESVNTLQFAMNAGAIKNQVQMNEKIIACTSQTCREQMKEYTEVIEILTNSKKTLEATLVTQSSKVEELQNGLISLQQENERGKLCLGQAMEEVSSVTQRCVEKDRLINELRLEAQTY